MFVKVRPSEIEYFKIGVHNPYHEDLIELNPRMCLSLSAWFQKGGHYGSGTFRENYIRPSKIIRQMQLQVQPDLLPFSLSFLFFFFPFFFFPFFFFPFEIEKLLMGF